MASSPTVVRAGGIGGSLVKVGQRDAHLGGRPTPTPAGTTLNAGGLVVKRQAWRVGVTMNGGTLGGKRHDRRASSPTPARLAPGNSIGTLTVNGQLRAGGPAPTYQVEVNAVGQGDRINVGGTATINGGNRAGAGPVGHLRPQHHLHHPERDRRRERRPTRV